MLSSLASSSPEESKVVLPTWSGWESHSMSCWMVAVLPSASPSLEESIVVLPTAAYRGDIG